MCVSVDGCLCSIFAFVLRSAAQVIHDSHPVFCARFCYLILSCDDTKLNESR